MPSNPLSGQRMLSKGGDTLFYTFERKRVKNLNLRIRSDGSVYLSAHPRVSLAQAEAFLLAKWDFIRAAQAKFAQRQPAFPAEYAEGASIYVLGQKRHLHLIQGMPEGAVLEGEQLCVTIRDPDDGARVSAMVQRFFRQQAEAIFPTVLQNLLPLLSPWKVTCPHWRVRVMKSRWGSCLPGKGTITLNLRLMAYPLSCVEYVVLHELCHFVHPNHSPAFHALMTALMPDWKQRRQQLQLLS